MKPDEQFKNSRVTIFIFSTWKIKPRNYCLLLFPSSTGACRTGFNKYGVESLKPQIPEKTVYEIGQGYNILTLGYFLMLLSENVCKTPI